MSCSIQLYTFIINGSMPSSSLCTASQGSKIELDAVVTFTADEAGKTVYAKWDVRYPDNSVHTLYWTPTYTVPGTTTYTFTIDVTGNFSALGNYVIQNCIIMDSSNNTLKCAIYSSPTGCGTVTLQTGQYTLHWSASGQGNIAVWRNGTFVDYVIADIPMGISKTFTFNVGDNFKYQAYPASGWYYDTTCDNTGCDSSNPYQATINQAMENTFTSNFGQSTCTNPKYKCSAGTCISDNCDGSGTFTTNNCNNTCSTTCTNPKYKCSKGICISDNCDGSGTFTTNNCSNTCTATSPLGCDPIKCPSSVNYCISGQCVPKLIIYGAAALLIFNMIQQR